MQRVINTFGTAPHVRPDCTERYDLVYPILSSLQPIQSQRFKTGGIVRCPFGKDVAAHLDRFEQPRHGKCGPEPLLIELSLVKPFQLSRRQVEGIDIKSLWVLREMMPVDHVVEHVEACAHALRPWVERRRGEHRD